MRESNAGAWIRQSSWKRAAGSRYGCACRIKEKEGDKALLKEAEAVVKAEKDLDSVSHLEKEESNERVTRMME